MTDECAVIKKTINRVDIVIESILASNICDSSLFICHYFEWMNLMQTCIGSNKVWDGAFTLGIGYGMESEIEYQFPDLGCDLAGGAFMPHLYLVCDERWDMWAQWLSYCIPSTNYHCGVRDSHIQGRFISRSFFDTS